MPTPIEANALRVATALFEGDNEDGAVFDGVALATTTQLSPRNLNDAIEYLLTKGLVVQHNLLGITPYEFGSMSLNMQGRQFYYEMKQRAEAVTDKPQVAQPVEHKGIRVFISHSSKDVEVAKEVIQLLHTALGLRPEDIRCTSVDGYRLPAGASTDEQLKAEIFDSEVFIGLVSADSMQSHYTLFELGARWGARRLMLPLIIDARGTDLLRGPLQGINALNAYEEGQLLQFITEAGKQLGIAPDNPSAYLSLIKRLVGALPSASAKDKAIAAKEERAITESADDYTEAEQMIKNHCALEWPDNFTMRKHCIEEQRKAVQALRRGRPTDVSEDDFALIRKRAALDWPDNFTMRSHQEQDQFQSLRSLNE